MGGSRFYEDKRREEVFGRWLDSNFYSRYKDAYGIERNEADAELQKRGVDVIVTRGDNSVVYVDEKAALHYVNRNISTFAFEVMNQTSGRQGWLYNSENLTDKYLLAWVRASDDTLAEESSITSAEIMVLARDKVRQLLDDNYLVEPYIRELVDYCRADGYSLLDDRGRLKLADGIYLYFNTTLWERPVNIVIDKRLLSQYAAFHEVVYS